MLFSQQLTHNNSCSEQACSRYILFFFLSLSLSPQLDRVAEAHRRSSERMLEQLGEAWRSHGGALLRLEEQERNHGAFIQRSRCLTALLEQDRQRSVHQTPEVDMHNLAKKTQIHHGSR